jgi:hypothetical protein
MPEAEMKFGTAIAIAAAFMMLGASAEAKRDKNSARPKVQAPAAMAGHGPARMIEARPGYWISSYGCALDAGYGRFTPCDLPDGNR